ncbi:hypothetical protein FH972_002418 [Carpinus fangiana]|uniref:Uncharacterized protein n=1 Tax=Carpinus fangiana TaxID=176857 RepID=A0A5N6QET2_9ROSI|nr:hypothetical protein FH972_002418 [Carpinus fangiana]
MGTPNKVATKLQVQLRNSTMESCFLEYPNSDFSPESFYGKSFSWDELLFHHNSLPFNLNDSEEMLLLDVLAKGAKETWETSPTLVRNSLQDMKYRCEEGCSPVVALKRKHSMRRKLMIKKSKGKKDTRSESVVVLEDLGAEYLEELLSLSPSETESASTK